MAEERPLELISTKMLEILQTLVSAEHEDFKEGEKTEACKPEIS